MKDEVIPLGFDEDEQPARHSLALFFHFAFRTSALLAYAFCGWFSSSFVTSFIVVVLLCAFDFWTVKNVTGRMLAGLRWWNKVDAEGQSQWVFESRKKGVQPLPSESRLFWAALIIYPLIWVFFSVTALFSLKWNWLMAALVGASMTCTNLYGYIRCAQGQKSLREIGTHYIGKQVLEQTLKSQTSSSNN